LQYENCKFPIHHGLNMMHFLITGGAGFIGSFLAEELLRNGSAVRLFDNLEEQVHRGKVPAYLPKRAEFIQGDVRDRDALRQALAGIDAVIHCAAAVGVAQSQYEIKRYVDTNVSGTANLLDIIVREELPVRKLLVPTSMTAYGEGAYRCNTHGEIRPGLRGEEQLRAKDWAPRCPLCRAVVEPIPTTENAERQSATIYALTKNMQEDMILSIARTYGIQATALRLFNVYGPRQSLSNPYTGVTAIFLSRLKNHRAPVIFEDGGQSRDFVSVHDVVRAFMLALSSDPAAYQAINIGSGVMTSIKDIAITLSNITGTRLEPEIPGRFRVNDVRHCFADTSRAKSLLGWEPGVMLEQGMRELVAWSERERAVDYFADADRELVQKQLTA
jgi:dTDP-L-rhamnose 4-epimerase